MESLLSLMKCRSYTTGFSPKSVPKEFLVKILEAGILSPSGPIDGTHIIVVDDSKVRSELRTICEKSDKAWVESQPETVRKRLRELPECIPSLGYLEKAPFLIVVTTRPRDPEVPYAVETAFLAVGYMIVMIKGLGLETAPHLPSVHQGEDFDRLNQILGLPEGEQIQALLPIGYPLTQPAPQSYEIRLNVYRNSFGKLFKPDQQE